MAKKTRRRKPTAGLTWWPQRGVWKKKFRGRTVYLTKAGECKGKHDKTGKRLAEQRWREFLAEALEREAAVRKFQRGSGRDYFYGYHQICLTCEWLNAQAKMQGHPRPCRKVRWEGRKRTAPSLSEDGLSCGEYVALVQG
jgi:hypothetical protein